MIMDRMSEDQHNLQHKVLQSILVRGLLPSQLVTVQLQWCCRLQDVEKDVLQRMSSSTLMAQLSPQGSVPLQRDCFCNLFTPLRCLSALSVLPCPARSCFLSGSSNQSTISQVGRFCWEPTHLSECYHWWDNLHCKGLGCFCSLKLLECWPFI